MQIFIDNFRIVRIESDIYIDSIELKNNRLTWFKNEKGSQFFRTDFDIELHTNDIIIINHKPYPLQIGLVTLTPEFEKRFRYDGPLGYQYTKSETSFYLFSPVAKQINLVLSGKTYEMTYESPIWYINIPGDWHLETYYFQVKLVDTFKDVNDPYTLAASTKGSHVVDFSKTERLDKTPIKLKKYVDAVIYEGHVRDMTIALDITHKGLFDGLIEQSKMLGSNVLTYIKKLGMTHLQLLPVFDFEGVDDENKDFMYNWGYNPSQYFALEGWYSKKPSDPLDRINSFKKIVKEAHAHKLGINLDVVFNHVYNHKTHPYNDIVPGYFYRHDKNNQMTDSSYCGNDLETRNYMVRKLIVDNLVHYTTVYQIDGYRFDLMGLLDLDTMHLIEEKLKAINPYIMLYGEGWNMPSEVAASKRANMNNQAAFKNYAHFNDFYRNTMKGKLYGDSLGYPMGNDNLQQNAMLAITGSPQMFSTPNQSINFIECHDNLTFYDKMVLSHGMYLKDFKVTQDFANHLVAISQGIPFYHAGQEFYRSKKGIENSYNSANDVNRIWWRSKDKAVTKLKKLLKIRKKYELYRQETYHSSVQITKQNRLLIYRLEDEQNILIHYLKNYYELEKIPLQKGKLIFSSQKTMTEDPFVFIDQPGVYIVHIKK